MATMVDGLPAPDEDKGPTISALTWVLCSIAIVLVLARLWTRLRIVQSIGWDDAFACLALICGLVNSGLMQVSLNYGTGRHIYYLTAHQALNANKFNWVSQGFHVMSTNWGKVSIAFFLLRIVDRAKHQKKYFYSGIILLTLINSASVGIIYGQCQYSEDLWTPPDNRRGWCWNPEIHMNVAFFQGSISAFTDLVLAVYPLFVIWNLNMARRLKVIVSFVMMLGVIAMVAAIVKTIYLKKQSDRADYTFETSNLNIWIAMEQYLIIIAASIPALAPLFKMARGQSYGKSSAPAANHYSYGPYSKSRRPPTQEYHRPGDSTKLTSTRRSRNTDSYQLGQNGPYGRYGPYGPYGATGWALERELDEDPREDSHDSEETTEPERSQDIEQGYGRGIVKTFEVQVQSNQNKPLPPAEDGELELPMHVPEPPPVSRYAPRRHRSLSCGLP